MIFNYLSIAVTALTLLLVPTMVFVFRVVVKFTKSEDKLDALVQSVQNLVIDKDKVHSELLNTMRTMFDSLDQRQRFMEEFFMRKGFKDD